MKNKGIHAFTLCSFALVLLIFNMIGNAFSYFSDTVNHQKKLQSGMIGIEISGLSISAKDDQDAAQNSVFYNLTVAQLTFTVENIGSSAVEFTGILNLGWLDDALNESGRLLIFPATIDTIALTDEAIMIDVLNDDDSLALIKLDANDQNLISSVNGDYHGLQVAIEEAGLFLDPSESKDYHYKLVFVHDNYLLNPPAYHEQTLELVVDAEAHLANQPSSWITEHQQVTSITTLVNNQP